MASITTRSGKGSPLTNAEVDGNFTNLNTELGEKEVAANKGVANGYASLDASVKVPSAQLPIGSAVQAWDGDLDAIAALSGTSGFLKKTAANTWSLDTSSYVTTNTTQTISGNKTLSGVTTLGEIRNTNSNVQSFSQTYSVFATNSYFENAEYLELMTVTPSASSLNYFVLGRICIQSGANTQTIYFNVGLRSNTLPSLSWSTSYYEEVVGGVRYANPLIWTKQTSPAAFKIALQGLATVFGTITVDVDIVHRSASTFSDVAMNTTQSSETAAVATDFTSQVLSRLYSINNGVTYDVGLTASITGNASTATALQTGRTIGMTGDVTWTSASFDGSANVTGTATLANSGVSAGTYTKVTVDAKGRVTIGASLASGDLPTYTGTITSSQVTTALGFTPENAANKGAANGYASLDASAKVPAAQLPSYVDDVLEYANLAGFPATGTTGTIYVALDTNKVYRWGGSSYTEISPSPGSTDAVPEGSTNLYFTNTRARNAVSATGSISYNSSTGVFSFTDAVTSVAGKTGAVTLTSSDVGLGNVENKSSATIRGELTSGNVTTALGYTPPQPNGTGASGTWGISITGNAATVSSITSGQVTTALGYTPYPQANNPGGYITPAGGVNGATNGWSALDGYGTTVPNYGGSDWWVGVWTGGNDSRGIQLAGGYSDSELYFRKGNTGWSAWRRLLTDSNYTSYAMALRGDSLSNADWNNLTGIGCYRTAPDGADANGPPINQYGNLLVFGSDNGRTQIQAGHDGRLSWRTKWNASDWTSWSVALDSGNYTSYAPSLTGSGASGTWSINVTGNAGSASSVAWGNVSSKPSNIMYYQGFTLDANTMDSNATGFTYSNNAPHTGPVARFSTGGGYDLWLNAPYTGGGTLSFRTRNGDTATLNAWRTLLSDSNYNSYAPTLTGGGASGTWGINITGNAATASKTSSNSGYTRVGTGMAPFYNWGGTNGGASAPTDSTYTTGIDVGSNPGDQAYGFQIASNMWNVGLWTRTYNSGFSGWVRLLDSSNYTSYSPSLTGSGASGTWSINVTGNAGTAYGLNVHTGRNNDPDKVVRTDSNGYIQAGWINTLSGDNGTTAIDRVYASSDGYIRYYTPANFRTVLDVPTRGGSGASGTWSISVTGDAGSLQGYQWGSAGKDVRASQFYVDNWFRNYNSGTGLYNEATSNHFYSDGQYWNVGYAGTTGIRLRNGHAGTILGYLYAETSGNMGLLNSSGSWAVQVYPGATGGGNLSGGWTIGGNTPLTSANYTSYAVGITNNSSLNSDSRNTRGVTRLYRRDDNSDYSVQTYWTGSYWRLYGYNGDTGHADTQVGLADSATNGRYVYDNGTYSGGAAYREASSMHVYYSYLGRLVYNNGAYSGSGWVEASDLGVRYAARSQRANGNFYIDDNYGNGIVGVYASTRYQGVFAMGDAYKLPADGTSTGSLYGMAWSHPNTGGVAGNLDSHGMLVLINGGFGSCMSYSIVASGNVTAYSDERLKTNWRPMPESFVDRLATVKVGIYDRTDGEKITQVGVSAQSLQEVLPQAITKAADEMGTLSVSYGNAAMASVVEIAKELVQLKKELAEIKAKLS